MTGQRRPGPSAELPADRRSSKRGGWFGPAVLIVALAATLSAQELLDRVAARVDSSIILLSDVRAAVALGVIAVPPGDPDRAGVELLIERQVILGEVARFPAPEPTELAVDELLATMKLRAGSQLGAMIEATGIDEAGIRALARDTLRIQAYVSQRFGAAATVDAPEVRQWIRDARARATVVGGD